MNALSENRKLKTGQVFLFGLVVGVVCYLLAEFLTPKQVADPGEHDLLLANRLGFIYTPVVGLWVGWLQRSWRRASIGALVGIIIGALYLSLCESHNFLAIMVGFPCLLGGAFAALVSSNRSNWFRDSGARLGKGLLAGLVLGFVYMVVLNLGGFMFGGLPIFGPVGNMDDFTQRYIAMMWRTGPVALGISGGLFFILIRWALGLTRAKLFVFEDVGPLKKEEGSK
jgi:hypothetical protein